MFLISGKNYDTRRYVQNSSRTQSSVCEIESMEGELLIVKTFTKREFAISDAKWSKIRQKIQNEKMIRENPSMDARCIVQCVQFYVNTPLQVSIIYAPSKCSLADVISSHSIKDRMELVLLAYQTVKCVSRFHKCGYLHGAIEPAHLLLNDNSGTVQLCGIGDSIRVGTRRNGPIGNIFYNSVNLCNKNTLTELDDLEALCFVVVELLGMDLPHKQLDTVAEILAMKCDFNKGNYDNQFYTDSLAYSVLLLGRNRLPGSVKRVKSLLKIQYKMMQQEHSRRLGAPVLPE